MRALNEQGTVKGHRCRQLLPRPARGPHRPHRIHPGGQPDRDPPLLPAAGRPQPHGRAGVQHESWGGFAEGHNNLFSDPTLTEIGAAHGTSIAQVVLRWLTQRNIAAIPKSVRPERMAQNLDIFRFTSPTMKWPTSLPWTPAPPCSSTTATPRWSAPSATAPFHD